MSATLVHPAAFVDERAQLGTGVEIGPGAVIGPQVRVGDGATIGSHALVTGWTTVGARCTLHHGAVVGSPPQDLKYAGEPSQLVIGEVVPTSDATPGATGDDEDEFNRAVPMAASAAGPAVAAPEFDEDANDSIGNRLAPGEVREELIPRGGAKKPPSSRRPATAPPRRRAAVVPTHHASGHGASKRAPRARKTRRSRP